MKLLESLTQAVGFLLSGDREVFSIALTSLWISLASVSIAALGSLPLGFLLGYKSFRGRKAVIVILNSLMAVPTVVVGLFVYSLLSRSGPLGSLGFLFTPKAVIIGQSILCFPIIASLVYGALSRLDIRIPETLATMGVSQSQKFWMILKEARIAIASAVLAGFGRVIGEVGVSMILGGNIRWYTRTMTTAIALETTRGEFERGIALGIILVMVAFVVNAALHSMVKHER